MNILSWLMGLSLMLFLFMEATLLHKSTVCRQKAWLLSTELLTSATLNAAPEGDKRWNINCKLMARRKKKEINWWRLKSINQQNKFEFDLPGAI